MNKQGKILVVDDTHETLQLLTRILRDEGYTVFPADSGELALASLKKRATDLILLDVLMPGIDRL
jgi:CheY-like chemotaxis protein